MGENFLPNGIWSIQFGKISKESVVVGVSGGGVVVMILSIIKSRSSKTLSIAGTLQEMTQFFAMICHNGDSRTCLLV